MSSYFEVVTSYAARLQLDDMNGQALDVSAPLLADLASVLDCMTDVEECQLNKDKSAGLQESVSRGLRSAVVTN